MLLGIIIVVACAYLAGKAIQDARSRAWTGPRTPAMRTRASSPRIPPGRGKTALRSLGTAAGSAGSAIAHPSSSTIRAQAKADAHRAWTEVRATDWLEQQRHARSSGTPANGTVTATAARPGLRQKIGKLAPFAPAAATAASGGADGNGQDGTSGRTANQPAQGNGGPPARPSPPPAQPATNGGTPVAGTAAAEQLTEGINRIHAEAAAGGIHHKQAAMKAATEGSVRFSGMAQMLARTMSEPGNNYGPEITEPLGKAAQHLQAAAMAFTEADNALTSMIHMTVGELATSPRQAPHHSELSENGSK